MFVPVDVYTRQRGLDISLVSLVLHDLNMFSPKVVSKRSVVLRRVSCMLLFWTVWRPDVPGSAQPGRWNSWAIAPERCKLVPRRHEHQQSTSCMSYALDVYTRPSSSVALLGPWRKVRLQCCSKRSLTRTRSCTGDLHSKRRSWDIELKWRKTRGVWVHTAGGGDSTSVAT